MTEALARAVEEAAQVQRHRDELMTGLDRANSEIAMLRGEIDQVRQRAEMLAAERDHYMRQSTEWATLFSVVQTVILDARENAQLGPFRRSPIAKMPAAEAIQAAQADLKGTTDDGQPAPAFLTEKVEQ